MPSALYASPFAMCLSSCRIVFARFSYRGTYTYDERGREVNEKRVYANGNIASERITEYHADGSRTEYYYSYDSNKQEGTLSYITRSEYDAQGKEQHAYHYDADGDLEYFYIYYYNGDGQLRLEQSGLPYDGDENSEVVICYEADQLPDDFYLENGQDTSQYKIKEYYIEEYNASGNLIETRAFNADGVQTHRIR